MFDKDDYQVVMKNEVKNSSITTVCGVPVKLQDIAVVSDGYAFKTRHTILSKLPHVAVLAVNGALRKWTLMTEEPPKSINAYIINNPYEECLSCLPSKDDGYYPVCVASSRTNYQFVEKYQGDLYMYLPTPELNFGMDKKAQYHIDDYRNPICAAIGLAYRFGVRRLMLLCCDDSFAKKRDFAVELENDLWTYPHHLRSQEIIDANLYWLTHQEEVEVKAADFSDGMKYTNALYIASEEEAIDFFTDQEEGTQT